MIRPAVLASALLAPGCSPPSAGVSGPAVPNVVIAAPPAGVPDPAPARPADPPGFEYPADLGGKAVARAVAPDAPAPAPAERFGAAPLPRTPPERLLEPEQVVKGRYVPPPLLPPPGSAGVKLAAPPERVPPDLGAGAAGVPARPTFPVAAGVTERARDVNLPPPLPVLGRPAAARVSLDDPTTEAAHAAVAGPAAAAPRPAGFLKVTRPDPFELGGQVRPRVPPAAEPGLTPVPVDPKRVK